MGLLFCVVFAVSVFVVGWFYVVCCGYVEYGFPFPEFAGAVERES